ncbi:MAG TPA: hypothetical protein VLX60_09870 [Terriglobales bacterium]|nr:hypothetical protein [Terriglobales bacterium]
MKRPALVLLILFAAAAIVRAKDWKPATIIGVSQTTVTSPMMHGPKIIMHYTVSTDKYTLFVDYAYHPPSKPDEPEQPGKNSPPSVPLGEPIKIAIEGHHAYFVDANGKEVKMDIKRKMKN